MAQNLVEYHIQDGAIFTFKVKAGQTIKIGQIVELTGDREVAVPAGASNKLVGVVYGGTVGIDGIGTGFKGDNGDVVSVVVFKPFVYLEAGGAITAGDTLTSATGGKAVKHTATATYVANEEKQTFAMAIQSATNGQRFVAILK